LARRGTGVVAGPPRRGHTADVLAHGAELVGVLLEGEQQNCHERQQQEQHDGEHAAGHLPELDALLVILVPDEAKAEKQAAQAAESVRKVVDHGQQADRKVDGDRGAEHREVAAPLLRSQQVTVANQLPEHRAKDAKQRPARAHGDRLRGEDGRVEHGEDAGHEVDAREAQAADGALEGPPHANQHVHVCGKVDEPSVEPQWGEQAPPVAGDDEAGHLRSAVNQSRRRGPKHRVLIERGKALANRQANHHPSNAANRHQVAKPRSRLLFSRLLRIDDRLHHTAFVHLQTLPLRATGRQKRRALVGCGVVVRRGHPRQARPRGGCGV